MTRAVIPGSFDPVTNGHLDIIERAAGMFDTIVVAVATSDGKAAVFTMHERMEMLTDVCRPLSNVFVDGFEGLLVNYAIAQSASVIVKGLRAVSDFEYELQMALMNKRLADTVETVFMMTSTEYSYLSSSIVKEIARLGGSVKGLVPHSVERRLQEKLAQG